MIGGTTAASRNVISGNGGGIDIVGSANLVQGNFIGTNAAGTAAVRSGCGVSIFNLSPVTSTDNLIGGTAAGSRQSHFRKSNRDIGQRQWLLRFKVT